MPRPSPASLPAGTSTGKPRPGSQLEGDISRPTVNQLLSDLLSPQSPRDLTPTQQRDSSSYRTQPYPAGERHEPWNPQALTLSTCRLTPALEQQGPAGRGFRINFTHHWTGTSFRTHWSLVPRTSVLTPAPELPGLQPETPELYSTYQGKRPTPASTTSEPTPAMGQL